MIWRIFWHFGWKLFLTKVYVSRKPFAVLKMTSSAPLQYRLWETYCDIRYLYHKSLASRALRMSTHWMYLRYNHQYRSPSSQLQRHSVPPFRPDWDLQFGMTVKNGKKNEIPSSHFLVPRIKLTKKSYRMRQILFSQGQTVKVHSLTVVVVPTSDDSKYVQLSLVLWPQVRVTIAKKDQLIESAFL